MLKQFQLTSSHLKWLAMITMLIDHIGILLFPDIAILRIIGRISFPLYAFLIGEGCKYTKNKWKYFRNVFITLVIFQIVHFVATDKFRLSVLGGFSLFILFTILLDWAKNDWNNRAILVALVGVTVPIFLLSINGEYLFFPFIFPLISYIIKNKHIRLLAYFATLVLLGFMFKNQMWCLFTMLPLFLYNGQKGNSRCKYLFYAIYPIHYIVLYAISCII